MIKKLFFLSLSVIFGEILNAQNFNMSTDSIILNCSTGGTLYDSGGNGSDYSNSENDIFTICPNNGDVAALTFISGMIGNGDFLCIYDGDVATAPLLVCLNSTSSLLPNTTIRAGVANPTGCLTLQFVSDASITGNFEFEMECLTPCQSVIANLESTSPAISVLDANYTNICFVDTIQFFGEGIYNQNNLVYNQNDATSSFYWDFGDGITDTAQNPTHFYSNEGIYQVSLVVEDNNGCTSINEIASRVRKSPIPMLDISTADSILCLGDTTTLLATRNGGVVTGTFNGDTITFDGSALFIDTVFLPDDSDGNSWNGVSTPVIYPLNIGGYQTGATLTNVNDLLQVCLEIEHSYIGDLDIVLVCPNGQQMFLMDNEQADNAGSIAFGSINNNDDFFNNLDPASNPPGSPLTYCWSPASILSTMPIEAQTNSYTFDPSVPNPYLPTDPSYSDNNVLIPDTYSPEGNWGDLLGCPLNGNWEVQILDDFGSDNGWTFSGSIQFNPSLLAENDTFPLIYFNPMWEANTSIISPLNADNIIVVAEDTSNTNFTFTLQDQFGCFFEETFEIDIDDFSLQLNPNDTVLCIGDSVNLIASVDANSLACVAEYNVSQIPFYLESSLASNPLVFDFTDDGETAPISLPFTFDFFCLPVTEIIAQTNGAINLIDNGFDNTEYLNQVLPNPSTPNGIIALMWDDLNDTYNNSTYFTTGTAPNRKFTVDLQLEHLGSGGSDVFGQIILHETTGIIDISCSGCDQDGSSDPSATQGIENQDGTVGYTVSGRNNTAWSASNETWRFAPSNSVNNYSYMWSPNNGTISNLNSDTALVYPAVATNYIVEVTNSQTNCIAVDTVGVFLPGSNYTISNDTTICEGQTVPLEATGAFTYNWTPDNNSLSNTSVGNPFASPSATTTYTVEFDAGGCSSFDSVIVTVNEEPTSIINNGQNPVGFCGGTSTTLTTDANPNWSLTWAGPENGTGTSIDISSEGLYTLTMEDINGCTNDISVNVIAADSAILDFSDVRNILCCTNDEIRFTLPSFVTNGTAIAETYFDNVLENDTIVVSSNGVGETLSFPVRYVTTDGCQSSGIMVFDIKCINPTIAEVDTFFAFNTESFALSTEDDADSYNYVWTVDNNAVGPFIDNTAQNAAINVSDNEGFYTAMVEVTSNYTLNNGDTTSCIENTDEDFEVVAIIEPQFPDAFSPNGDGDNPLFLPLLDPLSTITDFRIYNRWNELVYSLEQNNNGWDGTYNGKPQPSANYTYFIKIVGADGNENLKEGIVTLIR